MCLENKFDLYKETSLSGLWIHYRLIEPLIENLSKELFINTIIGYSENNLPIHKIQIGKGKIKILLWSQMHGDESTATKSLFDLINFISKEHHTHKGLVRLLQKCTLIIVPIVNPDGALAYTRENTNGIDLNRDAQKLNTKEARILHELVTSVKPDFAFNLHDQTSWYNVTNTDRVATLSFLSPSSDVNKRLTQARREAMRVIVSMFESLQAYLPNQMGRYDDSFCESCFGDSIQQMDFPTILIESGYYPKDEMREKTRKFHFIALMSALFAIASDKLPKYEAYFDIPLNEKLYFDVRYDNVLLDNKLTSVAVRYIYKIVDNKLIKVINLDETISGNALTNKLFHTCIDAKGIHFDDLS